MFKKLYVALSCIVVCVSSLIPVSASENTGSLNIKMKNPEEEAIVEVYQAASYENGQYVLNEDFSKCMDNSELRCFHQLNKESVKASELEENAEMLLHKAEEHGLKAYYKGEIQGECSLSSLPLGMYLVTGTMKNGKQEMLPSLIGVPYWDESHELIYDVTAYAKIGDQPETPETTEKPEHSRPKPGQDLNTSADTHFYLYAVLLAFSSLILFFLLRKNHHESK